jgi:hypothetical protein
VLPGKVVALALGSGFLYEIDNGFYFTPCAVEGEVYKLRIGQHLHFCRLFTPGAAKKPFVIDFHLPPPLCFLHGFVDALAVPDLFAGWFTTLVCRTSP